MSRAPQRSLAIESKYRARIFQAIVEVAMADPVLAANVVTWRSREGNDDDMQPPTLDMMPMVAFSPVPRPNTVLAVDQNKINFGVSVQVFVQGTCVDDGFALWEAIEDAFVAQKPFRPGVPGEEIVANFLGNCVSPCRGAMDARTEAPAFFGVRLPDPGKPTDTSNFASQSGVGMILCFARRSR